METTKQKICVDTKVLFRQELDQNLFALESILNSLFDSFVLPEDVEDSMRSLIILVGSKLGTEESYPFDVRSKLFLEIHKD